MSDGAAAGAGAAAAGAPPAGADVAATGDKDAAAGAGWSTGATIGVVGAGVAGISILGAIAGHAYKKNRRKNQQRQQMDLFFQQQNTNAGMGGRTAGKSKAAATTRNASRMKQRNGDSIDPFADTTDMISRGPPGLRGNSRSAADILGANNDLSPSQMQFTQP
eukprot:GHVT01087791.1.p1 GENE.GHVT01087791.1~~GHVT01087791.1.p1  ORF type:complete len:163 (-),score=27.92 GHVT01087791.1:828-1316(-)